MVKLDEEQIDTQKCILRAFAEIVYKAFSKNDFRYCLLVLMKKFSRPPTLPFIPGLDEDTIPAHNVRKWKAIIQLKSKKYFSKIADIDVNLDKECWRFKISIKKGYGKQVEIFRKAFREELVIDSSLGISDKGKQKIVISPDLIVLEKRR